MKRAYSVATPEVKEDSGVVLWRFPAKRGG